MRGTARASGRIVVAVAIAAIAAAANAINLSFLDFFGPLVVLPYALGMFAATGLVVALRRPHHPVGWLFLIAGTCYVVNATATAWTWRALVGAPGSLPGAELAAWLTISLWVPAIACTLLGIALFPNGRPPSPRWRPILAAVVAVLSVTAIVTAFAEPVIELPRPITEGLAAGGGTIPNPLRAPEPLAGALLAVAPLIDAVPVPVFLVALLAVGVRFRRATGIERQQLKWFALAAAVAIVLLTLSLLLPQRAAADVAWAAGMMSWGLVPVAIGIAILRHRLFDIDVVIRRTVVYGVVVVILATVYAGLVLVLQSALSGLTGNQTLPVALSTLAIAALFGPVRARVQRVIDRRFYRARYDAQATLEQFSAQVRDQVELEAVGTTLVDVARRAVHPSSATVWLRGRSAG